MRHGCARRVQSQYALPEGHAEAADCQAALDGAIRIAEQFASGEEPTAESVAQAEEATVRAIILVSGDENGNSAAAYAANAAYAAIAAATAGLGAMHGEDPLAAAEKVADAAAIAFDAATAIRDDVARAANLDWEMLHRMHLGKFPGVGEPVNPSEKGILGPLFSRIEAPRTNGAAKAAAKKQAEAAPPANAEAKPAAAEGPAIEEIKRAVEEWHAKAEEWRERYETVRAEAAELEQAREALEADREALNTVNSELERRRTEVEREGARLQLELRSGNERRQDGRGGLQAARAPAGTRDQRERSRGRADAAASRTRKVPGRDRAAASRKGGHRPGPRRTGSPLGGTLGHPGGN